MRRRVVDWLILIGLGIGIFWLIAEMHLPARELKILAVLGMVAFAAGLSPGIMYLWERRRKKDG